MKLIQIKGRRMRAFTLIESVIALCCMTLVVVLLASSTKMIQQSNKFLPRSNEVAYAYQKLQNFLISDGGFVVVPEESTAVRVVIRKIGPVDTKTNDPTLTTYVIEHYRNMIRVRGGRSGHMPLLIKIEKVSFSFDERQFRMKFIEENNEQSELIFSAKKVLKDFQ